MNNEELKIEISKQTGVPVSLLNGETEEENIAQAKALLTYKQEQNAKREQAQTTAAQFASWFEEYSTAPKFTL